MYTKENPFVIKDNQNISDISNVSYFEFRGYLFERSKYKIGNGRVICWKTVIADTTISVFYGKTKIYFVCFGETPRFIDLSISEYDTDHMPYFGRNRTYPKHRNMSMFKKSEDVQVALSCFFDEIFSRNVLLRLQTAQNIIENYIEKLKKFEDLIEIKDVLE